MKMINNKFLVTGIVFSMFVWYDEAQGSRPSGNRNVTSYNF